MSFHIIFDVNIGDNFCRNNLMVEGEHNKTTPSSLNYLSLVYQYSAKIALTMAAFYYLKVLACNIHNEYLTSK